MPITRNIGRCREIAAVLARHGFGWLLAELKLRDLLPIAQRFNKARKYKQVVQATHMRIAFEELGTTFIKLGQVLSTHPDLLSPEYIAELTKLQDGAPAVPYPQLAAVFEAELGAPPEHVFKELNPAPLASASCPSP
jgi:ubiquinone biosynthesis protein